MKADRNNTAHTYYIITYIRTFIIRENHNGIRSIGTLYYIGLVQQCAVSRLSYGYGGGTSL